MGKIKSPSRLLLTGILNNFKKMYDSNFLILHPVYWTFAISIYLTFLRSSKLVTIVAKFCCLHYLTFGFLFDILSLPSLHFRKSLDQLANARCKAVHFLLINLNVKSEINSLYAKIELLDNFLMQLRKDITALVRKAKKTNMWTT